MAKLRVARVALFLVALLRVTRAGVVDSILSGETKMIRDRVFLRLYGDTQEDYEEKDLAHADELLPRLTGKAVACFVHGYMETVESNSSRTIINAFLENGQYHVLGLDYSYYSMSRHYPLAVYFAMKIGAQVGKTFSELIRNGLNESTVHLIGHSLGGQLVGAVGRNCEPKIARITGLDPAGPLYRGTDYQLRASDAKFVDVIHTNTRFYGSNDVRATCDFFPNGGWVQAGCGPVLDFSKNDLCSHRRSWVYFAESVNKPDAFVAVRCGSYSDFKEGKCSKNEEARMGLATSTSTKGSYYLKTDAKSPYGLGEEGAQP